MRRIQMLSVGLLVVWVLGPLPAARAALGEDVSSVPADGARMKAAIRVQAAQGYTVQELSLPGGTRLREFVSPANEVFSVFVAIEGQSTAAGMGPFFAF